jgi:molecular chaperone DnaK
VYSTERLLEELKEKISESHIEKIRKELEALKKALEPEKKDIEALRTHLKSVNTAVEEATKELYSKAGAAHTHEHTEEPQGDEKVVDAEYEDVDKKKDKK